MVDVLIILGSPSDRDVAEKAVKVLEEAGVSYEVRVASAHRSPEYLEKIIEDHDEEVRVYIAIAGLAAHLPGVIAAKTNKPVIAVPVDAKLSGMDALLSSVQMPPGVPVATVGVDRGENAALLALRILALEDEEVKKFLEEYSEKLREEVKEADRELRSQLSSA